MNIEFDKRLELIYGLVYSVNRDVNNELHKGLFVEEMPNYNNEFYKLYKDNASEELIDYIKNYGMNGNWNQPAYIALSLDENYNIVENDTLIKEVINQNDKYDKNIIERLIKEFVLKSNYEDFFNNHKSLYDTIIKSYKESMSKFNAFDSNFIQDFYGYKVGNMSIKLYNFTSGSMGTLINDEQYYIQRVDNIGRDENNFIFKPKMLTMIHEFSHPYINPLVEKYFSNIDCSDIYNEIITSASNSSISDNYRLLLNDKAYKILMEYFVRTVTIVIAKKYVSKEIIDKEIQNQIDNGFIHIEDLVKLFDIKDSYNSFEEFFKQEMVNYFMKIKDNLLNKYLNQDIDNPIYLFHGSPKKLLVINPKQSHDSDGNVNNIANAVFLFPSFLKSTPYAFKDTIKENSDGLKYNFIIPNDNEYPLMTMENVNIDENIIGYIYVFKKDDDMIKDEKSYQYKCYKELIPIDVVEIKYKDFEKYYIVSNEKNKSL